MKTLIDSADFTEGFPKAANFHMNGFPGADMWTTFFAWILYYCSEWLWETHSWLLAAFGNPNASTIGFQNPSIGTNRI